MEKGIRPLGLLREWWSCVILQIRRLCINRLDSTRGSKPSEVANNTPRAPCVTPFFSLQPSHLSHTGLHTTKDKLKP